jgi:hypothetical protein
MFREILWTSFKAIFGDFGTNPLGWILIFSGPVAIAFIKSRRASKGERLALVRSQWKTEIRDILLFWACMSLLVFLYEAVWNIPRKIWESAESVGSPAFRVWSLPAIPVVSNQPKGTEDSSQSLRQRTTNLAKELFDFADQREGGRAELENKITAAVLEQVLIPGSRDADELKVKLQAWNQGTRNAFMAVYLPRLQQQMNDLEAAGVDTAPVTRAIATAGPREMGLRLSVLSYRIGKHPPYEREVTPLVANAVAQEGGLKHVEIYALKSDTNSTKVAAELRNGFLRRGRSVDEETHPLDLRKVEFT